VAARPGEPLATRLAARGVPVIPLAPLSEVDPRAVARLRGVIRREGVQIVHAHTGHAVSLAALATLRSPARVVVTRRVDFPLRRSWGTRWKYGRADAVIGVCRTAAESVRRLGIDPARVHVVHSGVDLGRRIEPAGREALEALGVPAGAPLVVQVAALVDHKDPLTFVRAMAVARERVPAAHALLVGEGGMRPAVEAELDALGLRGVVHLTGYRTDADALIAAADVVTLSSTAEGIAGVLIDAISLGKPVAATRTGGVPEVIVDRECGLLVPVGDAKALGEAIARLLTDRALARRLGEAGLARAPEFSIERTVERTIAVYRRLLGLPADR
jgi:glycosyltransferase involved in cell wall biosynthesis